MTFEEFFIKKRIDLAQLRRARPLLYEEFRDHYAQMSEKSFDHTKKYWFNRLRKDFLLEVVDTPKAAAGGGVVTKAAEKAEVDTATTTSAGLSTAGVPGFKPRFKPKVAKPTTAAPTKVIDGDEPLATPATKPTGFKPRFKPGVTTSSDKKAVEPPAAEPTPESSAKAATDPNPKPLGFKPRFKGGATPPVKPSAPSDSNEGTEGGAPEPTPTPESSAKTAANPKPLGFKPRFKGGSSNSKKSD